MKKLQYNFSSPPNPFPGGLQHSRTKPELVTQLTVFLPPTLVLFFPPFPLLCSIEN